MESDISMNNTCHCLLCGSSQFCLIHQKDMWKYLRCRNCGLVGMYPHPSDDELFGSYGDYLPKDPRKIKAWKAMMRPIIVNAAGLIESEPGRLLDIGSGYGFFLEEMKNKGWEVEGIELSETGRQYTQRRINVPVHSRPVEFLTLPENHFDVVTLFYVIEHLPDPVSTLREVRRIIRPGGTLLLRWPHSTPLVRLLGPFSRMFDLYHTPFHLYDFSPKTISMLLSASSFDHIRTVIGGYTLPEPRINRYASIITGIFAEVLFRLSGGRILVPGVSKTSVARNSGKIPHGPNRPELIEKLPL